MIQVARLRRAWSAVSLYFKQCDTDRSKVSATDLDSLLGDSELRDVKVAFWTRYRVRLPPELYPSDATVSRVSREMSKRLLCVSMFGRFVHCNSSSRHLARRGSWRTPCSSNRTRTRTLWPGIGRAIWTSSTRCWWPTPWLARAECQVLRRRLGRPSWGPTARASSRSRSMSSWPTTTAPAPQAAGMAAGSGPSRTD